MAAQSDDYRDFTNATMAKLLLRFEVDRLEASGSEEILAGVEVEMSPQFVRAIRDGRVRLKQFSVVGE